MAPGSGTGDCGPLRVAVDVSSLSGDSAYRGIGRYLSSILAALDERAGIELLRFDLPARRWRGSAGDSAAAAATDAKADMFWSPAQTPPQRCALPWAQTLHDLIPLVVPSKLTQQEARHWLRQRDVLQSATAVICPSRSSADQGVKLLGLDETRMHVVYHGLSAEFRPTNAPPTDPPYLLVVSGSGPHKGFDEAMTVVGQLADLGYPHVLRIVGPGDAWTRKQLDKARAASPHPERVEIVGYVEDLVAVYNQAAVLLCPSHAEGFGFPVAEAMACGTPVVAYDNTALPEVAGTAGLLVTDGDVAAMTAATRSILDDVSRADELRRAGLEQAAQWSWPRAAEQMESIFRAVISGHSVN